MGKNASKTNAEQGDTLFDTLIFIEPSLPRIDAPKRPAIVLPKTLAYPMDAENGSGFRLPTRILGHQLEWHSFSMIPGEVSGMGKIFLKTTIPLFNLIQKNHMSKKTQHVSFTRRTRVTNCYYVQISF